MIRESERKSILYFDLNQEDHAMLGYKTAREKGKKLYSSLDPYETGPHNLQEWWDDVIIIIVLAAAAGAILWLYLKF